MDRPLNQVIAGSHCSVYGDGDPIVVVHGGPGLEHSYLAQWLLPLATNRALVFYDQLGCGRDQTSADAVSATALIDQLDGVVGALDAKVSILAHSWGAYLAYEVMRRSPGDRFAAFAAISPVGLTRAGFDASGDRLISRIPEQVLDKVPEIEAADDDGVGVMHLLSPYYQGDPDRATPVRFASYRADVYEQVVATLDDYDCRDVAHSLPDRTVLVYGERDIEVPEATKELHDRARLTVIAKVGHFGFAEQPEQVLDALRVTLDSV